MFSGPRNGTKEAKNKCKLPQLQRKGNKNDLAEKSILKYLLFPWVCWKRCSPVADLCFTFGTPRVQISARQGFPQAVNIYIYIYIYIYKTVNQISSPSLCYASFSIRYLPTVLSFEASDTRVKHSTIINKDPNILSVSFANRISFSTSGFSQ